LIALTISPGGRENKSLLETTTLLEPLQADMNAGTVSMASNKAMVMFIPFFFIEIPRVIKDVFFFHVDYTRNIADYQYLVTFL
jgi:hypothetical protein